MKKLMTIGLVSVLTAGMVHAQGDVVIVEQGAADASAEVTAEVALVSAYVWRGQVLNNDFCVQPQISLSMKDFSFNVWGNYDLIRNNNGSSGDFSEIDLSLAYTLPVDVNDFSFDVGFISYNFPANGDYVDTGSGAQVATASRSTTEIFATATMHTFADYVIPSVTFFGDIGEVDGTYILFDVAVPYQISDYLSVEGGISAGWGNTSYNDAYFGTTASPARDKGFNDYNFYAVGSYEIMENVTASVNATYTMLEGGAISDSAKLLYEDNKKFWVGANVAYAF